MSRAVVLTYRNVYDFQNDVGRMARHGYQVVSSFQQSSRNRPLRNLLKAPVGGTGLWGPSITGGKIVVTYQAVAAPGARAGATRGSTAIALALPSAGGPLRDAPRLVVPTGREPLQVGHVLGGLLLLALLAGIALVVLYALYV